MRHLKCVFKLKLNVPRLCLFSLQCDSSQSAPECLIYVHYFWDDSGYMAPEYLMHGQLSVKADVFSYGVLVLELISGKKNSNFYMEPDVNSLLEWVRTQIFFDSLLCIILGHSISK